jgi:cobalt-zinc-cadmium efflux system outer membrane protein
MVVIATGLAVGGCASLDPAASFDDVAHDAGARTGKEIRWVRQAGGEEALSSELEDMLAGGLTPDEAVQLALLNSPRLQAQYERLGIAQADLVQAGLLKNPVFDIAYRFPDGGGDGVLEMAIAQDFLDVLMIPLRKRLAEAELHRTQREVTAVVLDLAADVRMGFIRLLSAREALALDRDILAAAEASYEMAHRLHDAGNITDLELTVRRASYEQAKLAVSSAELAVREHHERLTAMMGLWGGQAGWRPAGSLEPVPQQEMDLPDLERRAVAESVDLQVAYAGLRSAAARMGLEAAEMALPELALGAEAEREPGDEWTVGPGAAVAIPIFDLGQARTAAGRAELRRRWHELTALAVEIRSGVRRARDRMVNAGDRARYYHRVMVPLWERITQETQLEYNAMQVGVFRLLEAKQQEVRVRRAAIDARRDYWLARAELEQILRGRFVRVDSPAAGEGGRGAPPMGGGGNGH